MCAHIIFYLYAHTRFIAHSPHRGLDFSPSARYNPTMLAPPTHRLPAEGPTAEDFLAEMALSEMDDQGVGPQGGRYLATGGIRPRPRLRYSHHGMIDVLLMEPEISQNELAVRFGRTPAWISTIITSDAFQSALAARRAEVMNPEIALSLRERATALATKSMQVLQEKLNAPVVSDGLALKAFELASRATGMGGNAAPPAAPNPAEYLPAIAERLMRLQGRVTGEVVDAVPIKEGAGADL